MLSPSRKFSYPDQLRVVAEVYQKFGALLAKEYDDSAKNLGDEGGLHTLWIHQSKLFQLFNELLKMLGIRLLLMFSMLLIVLHQNIMIKREKTI
jgi:enolase